MSVINAYFDFRSTYLAAIIEYSSMLCADAAIFGGAELRETGRGALIAEAKRPVSAVNIGDVFYGNIGSTTRLDFTDIGPAVNEVNRIEAPCRSVDRDNFFSSNFVAATPKPERSRLVSVGRFALRGVSRAQDLCDRSAAGAEMKHRLDRRRPIL